MDNLNMFKERPQACLTKGSYAGCDTRPRWRGLESPLLLSAISAHGSYH